jgi:hypothetical protein
MDDNGDQHDSDGSSSQALISSVQVEPFPGHDRITVWNRGANAGTLTVQKGDGDRLGAVLLNATSAELLVMSPETPLDASTVEAISANLREMLTPAELAQLLELLALREL